LELLHTSSTSTLDKMSNVAKSVSICHLASDSPSQNCFEELGLSLQSLPRTPEVYIASACFRSSCQQLAKIHREDLSKRVVVEGTARHADLGFDSLVRTKDVDGSWVLEQFTQDAQICSLGRPL
jgi:hypothetical protein